MAPKLLFHIQSNCDICLPFFFDRHNTASMAFVLASIVLHRTKNPSLYGRAAFDKVLEESNWKWLLNDKRLVYPAPTSPYLVTPGNPKTLLLFPPKLTQPHSLQYSVVPILTQSNSLESDSVVNIMNSQVAKWNAFYLPCHIKSKHLFIPLTPPSGTNAAAVNLYTFPTAPPHTHRNALLSLS